MECHRNNYKIGRDDISKVLAAHQNIDSPSNIPEAAVEKGKLNLMVQPKPYIKAKINYQGQLSHPNLVKLVGYNLEDEHRLLVYEFMPRGSLENHLFRRDSDFQPLSWNLRIKVALAAAAKGLAYLHNPEAKVIYRDSKDGPADGKSHVSTRVMGTYGCIWSRMIEERLASDLVQVQIPTF
ncbi:hypothetical protein RJ639_037129 [Escallonia herrerae]|uniref:Protein kinase domain-containing protein n=1 Tax=Escallonia herrerae TaxID=1293975 RepID=A0AA89B949_9ASTE|nr:hypothetical protein RJ639_037129 [Escallonia herrerae]